VLMSNIVSVTW